METISYEYGDALYVNLTNRCDCACIFCLRNNGHKGSIYADDLWLEHEPSREEALKDLLSRDLSRYTELVFCGFGEPTYRIDDLLWLVDELKKAVPHLPPVRINTNGHANLIHGRDVTPGLAGRIDVLSIPSTAPPLRSMWPSPAPGRGRRHGTPCWTLPAAQPSTSPPS